MSKTNEGSPSRSVARDRHRPGVDRPITRDDIRAQLQEIAGPLDRGVDQAKGVGLSAAVAIGVVLVIGAFVVGRRRGRKRSTIVEIRRI